MPRYAAERTLLAPIEDVWSFVAEPYNLPDWWPGVSGVEPDRRGLAPAARWRILGPDAPTLFRKPDASGTLIVLDVVPMRRIAFQLVSQRVDAVLELEPAGEGRTKATLEVDGPFLAFRRSFPYTTLGRLYDLVQTGAEI
ncbi:MAG TPA: SRPBCC family protein [Gaiellaceae bacterium]|nr:SRPBCC family protein [Gaiellaceae bacterium]